VEASVRTVQDSGRPSVAGSVETGNKTSRLAEYLDVRVADTLTESSKCVKSFRTTSPCFY